MHKHFLSCVTALHKRADEGILVLYSFLGIYFFFFFFSLVVRSITPICLSLLPRTSYDLEDLGQH